MKSAFLASVAALVLSVGAMSANAADIQQRAALPAKAPVYMPPVFSWTGPYIGINGGYAWGDSRFNGPFSGGNHSPSGGVFGGTLGYNWQAGAAVFGVEGDFDWSGIRGRGPCTGATCTVRNDWLGTARGRLGYNAGRWMPYVTGGLAVGNIKSNISGVGNNDATKAGWTIGGGVEAAISGPWTAKIEYLYVDLGRGDNVPTSGGSSATLKTNIVRAGVNYKF
jgi:outer membrane immunogenic protein